jgi:peptide/nickel transport system substrate-binding protein
MPAQADEMPKYGGILTYMIPADSPPSFDAQREETYATIHAAAPFYSTLIRINPMNPGSATDIVCDLCTEMPTPTDGGTTYSFKITSGRPCLGLFSDRSSCKGRPTSAERRWWQI